MTRVRVIDMTCMNLLSLPSSLGLLTNLQTLCFYYCKLQDTSVVGDLKNLEILCLRAKAGSSQLKHLSVRGLRASAPNPTESEVALLKLETLYLSSISIERIWQNQVAAMSCGFQNLKRLILFNCWDLTCLFTSSIIGSFVGLQCLEICECPVLKEIIVIDQEESKNNIVMFPNAILDTISKSNNFDVMEMQRIEKRINILNSKDSSAATTHEYRVAEIVADDDEGDKDNAAAANDEIVFSELKELELRSLNDLTSFYSGINCAFKFPSLDVY
ncbi:hypothetical protein CUMW_154840 [Citrus unshiu]|nr:hypothetical protein CUMW_154840 [Citrus unshiu]